MGGLAQTDFCHNSLLTGHFKIGLSAAMIKQDNLQYPLSFSLSQFFYFSLKYKFQLDYIYDKS